MQTRGILSFAEPTMAFWRYRAGVKNGRNKSNGKPMVRTNVPKKVGFYQRNNERYAERYISG